MKSKLVMVIVAISGAQPCLLQTSQQLRLHHVVLPHTGHKHC